MDLILIRHPAVDVPAGMCYGQTDVPLLADAAESARALSARMDALGVPACVQGWRTSPLKRCRLVAEGLGAAVPDARLMEIDFGSWEGRNWDGIDRGLFDAWVADLLHARGHGGESLSELLRRVTQWFDEVSGGEGSGPVHVVTHAGVVRVLAGCLLGVEPLQAIRWAIDFGGIVWLRKAHGVWGLVKWNV